MSTIPRNRRRQARNLLIGLMAASVLSQQGCAPTYPKEILDKAVVQLCREEYNIDVKVKIMGNTVGIYIPIENLFDSKLNISKEAAESINDVILSASRVTLSTDAELNFYIVVAQDPILPEIEVVLIRYVKDIKMLHFDRISRGEFIKRMIIGIKLTPQAQKEKVLRSVFARLNIEDADKLVTEYLETSKVASIGDIGYWQDTFYMKDISMGEFLALQIADRVKSDFMSTQELKENFKLNLIKGEFLLEDGKEFFRFSFNASTETDPALLDDEVIDADNMLCDMILKEAGGVMHGYKFEDFWNIEIINTRDNKVVFAVSDELEGIRKNKTKKEELRQWYR
ncbi:MAG: hypothetical protein ABH875_06320 [Candidatus Omnitrophota bacterium]